MQYAIVDIETTGGYAAGSGITEIAILIHDGNNVIERYETLINPGRDIPLYIQSLTGIDNAMVANSPRFEEIAEEIFEKLSGKVFVAHSVNFDYSFLKHHLEQAGYILSSSKLCTVRLSRKIKPGLPSYSLGKLCDSLAIPISNRHRAGGDAEATALLFSKLIEWDAEGEILKMLKKTSKEQTLPPNVSKENFESLPQTPGVYYFKDRAGKVIYIGKAVNIKKRVLSHFTGHTADARRQHFMRDIYSIHFEVCATELMALLLESAEITRLWPQYNRAMKRQEPKFGLYCYEDINGFLRLAVGKHNKFQPGIQVFYREDEGRTMLHRLVRDFKLCPEYCGIGLCEAHQLDENSCLSTQSAEAYNTQVSYALATYKSTMQTFAIVEKGRSAEEQSCIWVENDCFYGMGYIDTHSDLYGQEDVKSILTQYQSNYYIMQLIKAYAQKHPQKIVWMTKSTAELA